MFGNPKLKKPSLHIRTQEDANSLLQITTVCTPLSMYCTKDARAVVVYYDRTMHSLGKDGWGDKPSADHVSLRALLEVASACTTAATGAAAEETKPLEAAIVQMCSTLAMPVEKTRSRLQRIANVEWNTHNRWSLTVNTSDAPTDAGFKYVMLMGAAERVFSRCSSVLVNGSMMPMSMVEKREFEAGFVTMATKGLRVVGFACMRLEDAELPFEQGQPFHLDRIPTSELTFCGMVGIVQQPRANARLALQTLRQAGVRVIVTTGQHPLIAESLAREIGLLGGGAPESVADGVAPDHPQFYMFPTPPNSEHYRGSPQRSAQNGAAAAAMAAPASPASPNGSAVPSPLPPRAPGTGAALEFGSSSSPSKSGALIVSGEELGSLSSAEMEKALRKPQLILAMSTPQHRLQLVAALHGRGERCLAVSSGSSEDIPLLLQTWGVVPDGAACPEARTMSKGVLAEYSVEELVRGLLAVRKFQSQQEGKEGCYDACSVM